jgi:hypothetical protein
MIAAPGNPGPRHRQDSPIAEMLAHFSKERRFRERSILASGTCPRRVAWGRSTTLVNESVRTADALTLRRWRAKVGLALLAREFGLRTANVVQGMVDVASRLAASCDWQPPPSTDLRLAWVCLGKREGHGQRVADDCLASFAQKKGRTFEATQVGLRKMPPEH